MKGCLVIALEGACWSIIPQWSCHGELVLCKSMVPYNSAMVNGRDHGEHGKGRDHCQCHWKYGVRMCTASMQHLQSTIECRIVDFQMFCATVLSFCIQSRMMPNDVAQTDLVVMHNLRNVRIKPVYVNAEDLEA